MASETMNAGSSTYLKSTIFTTFVIFTLPIIIHASEFSLTLSASLSIISIVWFGYLGGVLLVKMCSLLPALLIQLIVGLIFRSFGQKQLVNQICYEPSNDTYISNTHGSITCELEYQRSFSDISGLLRDTAMAVLVMRAGLGFDLNALKRVATTCLMMLTVLPCAAEILVCACLAPILLGWSVSGFTGVAFGCMMGCVLGAVTPAVIVPAVEDLKNQGLAKSETQKEIVNLIVAASSFDDVLAISVFNLILGVIISSSTGSENLTFLGKIWIFSKGPLFVILGLLAGYFFAIFLSHPMSKSKTLTIFTCLTLPFIFNQASIVLNISSAGPIACIAFGLIVVINYSKVFHLAAKTLDTLWLVLEPAMFVLIGAELDVMDVEGGWGKILRAGGLLTVCLGLRTLVAFLIAKFNGKFSDKQSLFISLAWLPKATVQAAIGGTALARFQSNNSSEAYLSASKDIVTIAVLSILVTAPLGAFLIKLLAPRLISEKDKNEVSSNNSVENSPLAN